MNRRRHQLLLPLVLVVLALFGVVAWQWPRALLAERMQAAPNPALGLCFVTSAEDPADQPRFDRARSGGALWDRYPFYWQNIEREPGKLDFRRQDEAVAQDVQYGLRTLGILMGTAGPYATFGDARVQLSLQSKLLPEWGSGRLRAQDLRIASAASPPRGLYEPIFADGTDIPGPGKGINPGNPWARFVHEVVSRYRPGGALARERGWAAGTGISHWEIWNEPDWSFFWAGSPADYYRLLKVAYLAAKQADPACTVLLGGLATYFNPGWFPQLLETMQGDPDQALRAANNHYFDALAVHFYSRSADALAHIQRARGLLARYGLNKPIWVTESGVPVWDDYPGPTWDPKSPYRATKEEQAAYVIQSHAYALYAGARVIFHFQLHDDCGNGPDAHDAYGLFRNPPQSVCYPSDAAARPSYQAYRVVAEQFRELQPLWRQTPNGDHELIAFYRPSTGQRLIVMWATQGYDVQASVAAVSTSAALMDMYGSVRAIAPQNGYYVVDLPRATNQNLPNSAEYMIGGAPFILLEKASPLVAAELIYNGGFEAGASGWQAMGSTPPKVVADCAGNGQCLQLGAGFQADPGLPEGGGNSTAYQELVLDPSLTAPTLRFRYRIQSEEEEAGHDWFEAIVIVKEADGSARAHYLIAPRALWQSTPGWQAAQFSLAPWRGKRVQVVFNVYQSSAERPTIAFVDDVSVREEPYTVILPLVRHGPGPTS